ncbi:MAG: sigma-70 family RNA polymerase sigma factor [Oscillospiraceae bacterium]|nr:sigma-70 family RNA polymerase sigma factor [Oscillospiraceae bacterium]
MHSASNGTFDDEYIGYLLDTYSDMLIKLCYSYVRSVHDAEDAAQEVFLEIIKRKPVFDDSEHEKAWLMRTAINKCKNHLKSSWVNKFKLSDDLSADVPEAAEDPFGSFGNGTDGISQDDRRHILEAVMGLPEKYRTVIHMYYYQGLSINEIAEIKQISPSTAGTHLARGRALLGKKLGGDFYG